MIVALTLALAIFAPDPVAARAVGDQILSAGQADGVFENVTDSDDIRLHHRASGMICRFEADAARNSVRIYPVRPGVRSRGDDVGCGTSPGAVYTVYATRYRPEWSEKTAMAQAVQEIEAVWTEVQRLDIAAPPGAADVGFGAFRGRHPNGQLLSTVILVRQIGPWTFKMRASGPPDQAEDLARSAAERFAAQIPHALAVSR
ncbi:MAG: hypothetical protein KKG14_05640 [Alphaproteobacteria bacterium]|nr:hypothetical protein [Alphaproteobacteria bacterium]MBU2271197.1 hypothetical protein [Alphaproteobacteria bacterium]MBU2418163.1 hypothetical protein [Alphaproteobacteria bacterium]